ncbi:hypothetical protein EDD86DRAFT_207305 [Gorgonomyces haynaldii]|nr:hypothetical protein EDD86DRAFT_207305 [Gorgonomyces haynaldii]
MRFAIGKLTQVRYQSEYSGAWSQDMEPLLSHDEFEKIKERVNKSAQSNNEVGVGAIACVLILAGILVYVIVSKSGGSLNIAIIVGLVLVMVMLAGCAAAAQGIQERGVTKCVQELNREFVDRNVLFEEETISYHVNTYDDSLVPDYTRYIHIYAIVAISPAQMASAMMYLPQMQSQMMNMQPQPSLPQQELHPSQPQYPPGAHLTNVNSSGSQVVGSAVGSAPGMGDQPPPYAPQ